MRRFLELTVLIGTAWLLVATSTQRPPSGQCRSESVTYRADTTCGPATDLVVTTSNCNVTAAGADLAGLPSSGWLQQEFKDAGLSSGFDLYGAVVDGGPERSCITTADDAGFTVACDWLCVLPDGGACANDGGFSCAGTLRPQ